MIVSKDIHPEKDLYFLGAVIIDELSGLDENIGFLELYRIVSNSHDVSRNLLALALTWLYMLGAIDTDETGAFVRCF